LKTILSTAPDQRTPAHRTELEKFFRANVDSPVRQAEFAVSEAKKKRDALMKSAPTVMVMREMPQPREAFLLLRGEYDKRGEKVTAALPAIFPPMPDGQPMNRLGLAKWIVDPAHPLTARVWVNRAWERFFGTGLVKTTENFGSQSEWPTHAELLDWLAVEFMQGARLDSAEAGVSSKLPAPWDMQALQKLIVMSATYRQATSAKAVLAEPVAGRNSLAVDPDNRWLSRGCNPMEGSSSTYSTPRSLEPICVARRMRCASPPERVVADRARVK